jgi:putative copper resistance protein D
LIDPLVFVRAIHFASCILVAGVTIFSILVAEPIWQRADLQSAALDNHRNPIAPVVWFGLALAMVSGLAHLVLVAGDITSESWTDVIADRMVLTVLMDTQFGLVSQLRLLLALVLACLLLLSGSHRSRKAIWLRTLAAIFSVLMLASLAWTGHAAGASGPGASTHLVGDVLHIVAAGIWVGGLTPLALFMWQTDGPGHRQVLRRFSNLGVISVAALFASGLINTWFLTNHMRGLIGTQYGLLLQIKIALFLAMLCLAAVNRLRLLPRLTEGATCKPGNAVTLRQLRRNTTIEVVLGLGVLYIVGQLGVTPPAGHVH